MLELHRAERGWTCEVIADPGSGTRFAYRFSVDGVPRSVDHPTRLTVDDGEALVEAATRSVGLVMVVDYPVEDLVRAGRLVRVLRNFEMPQSR